MAENLHLVLASASPRRAEILRALGIPFVVDPAELDEELFPGETGEAAVARLASAKAAQVAVRRGDDWVLAADTLVLLDGESLGKPRDEEDASRMLRRIRAREHRVVTAVRLRRGSGRQLGLQETSAVRIAPMSEEEIAWYVRTGEPRDKAGSYAVQGLGARFVESVEGSYSNVMGLPARGVYRLMREAAEDPALDRLSLFWT